MICIDKQTETTYTLILTECELLRVFHCFEQGMYSLAVAEEQLTKDLYNQFLFIMQPDA